MANQLEQSPQLFGSLSVTLATRSIGDPKEPPCPSPPSTLGNPLGEGEEEEEEVPVALTVVVRNNITTTSSSSSSLVRRRVFL